jgi:hypothetical protein
VFTGTTVALMFAGAGIAGWIHPFDKGTPSSAYLAAERHAVALVPHNASVSVTNHLGAHFAAREYLYVFPVVEKADWVVVETRDAWLPDLPWLRIRTGIDVGTHDLYWQPNLMRRTLRGLKRSTNWDTVYDSGGVSVFKRVHSQGTA